MEGGEIVQSDLEALVLYIIFIGMIWPVIGIVRPGVVYKAWYWYGQLCIRLGIGMVSCV